VPEQLAQSSLVRAASPECLHGVPNIWGCEKAADGGQEQLNVTERTSRTQTPKEHRLLGPKPL
jgi:hypothetical protein